MRENKAKTEPSKQTARFKKIRHDQFERRIMVTLQARRKKNKNKINKRNGQQIQVV